MNEQSAVIEQPAAAPRRGRRRLATLNRPAARNALSMGLMQALLDANWPPSPRTPEPRWW